MNNKKLDPKCFKEEMGFAITNRGELIPCCRCDNTMNDNDVEFQKLLAVSNISNYEKIEDILKTKPWKRFYKNLSNDIGPPSCYHSCKANKEEHEIQTNHEFDPKTNKTLIFRQR